MNIVVCIKQVPGTSKVDVDPKTGVLIRDGIDAILNPFDLSAIEISLKIKEQLNGKITCITMGPPQAEKILHESYFMGVDEGILLTDKNFAGADVLATSYTLSQGIQKCCKYDLIICGKQTTDGDTAQVGPELAEWLGVPHVANVEKIVKVTEKYIIVRSSMTETVDEQKIFYPCLISVEKDICTPRLPSYKKKREILNTLKERTKVVTSKYFGDANNKYFGLMGSPTQIERIFVPASSDKNVMYKGYTEELAQTLYKILAGKKFV